MKQIVFRAALCATAAVFCAAAGTLTINDTTLGGPIWNRPVANGNNPPVAPPSGVGTAVAYDLTTFTVDTSGSYTFQSTATSPAGWDNYSFLYQNSFNPLSQFTNVLIGNDDNPTVGLSGFAFNLTAGTTYIFVETGFGNTDAGAYTLDIRGPGEITPGGAPIPEPATAGLLLFGAAGLVVLRKFRRS